MASAQAADKPDLTGAWQLDVQRTRFGEIAQPKSLVIQIEHHEPQIRIVAVTATDQGETREVLDLVTNGTQRAQASHGQACLAAAHWDKWSSTRLVVSVDCNTKSSSRRYTVGAKGKLLTTVLTIKEGSVEKKAYEFFVKQ
jgi:hypothetical protein